MAEYNLHEAPGHLIRRFHQIGLSIFSLNLGDLDVTPLQFAVMWTLKQHPGIDQITLARSVALDRTTCSSIVARLEKKGRARRKIDPKNRRAKLVYLTPKGRRLLEKSIDPHREVQRRLLEPLNSKEKEVFLRCLNKLVEAHNDISRAPKRLIQLD